MSLIFSRTINRNNPSYGRDKEMMSKVKRTSYKNAFHNPGDRKSTVQRKNGDKKDNQKKPSMIKVEFIEAEV